MSNSKQPYVGFVGRLLRKWDWFMYCRAYRSLNRMCIDNPGIVYLLSLQMNKSVAESNLTPELKTSTENFFKTMTEWRADKS